MKSTLPAVLQEIADVAGETAALKISARHGGRRVYIPSAEKLIGNSGEHYWLVDCVGPELARKICEHFQVDGRGQRIEIPLHVGGTYRQFMRSITQRVHEMEAEGASSSEIARTLGVTQRTVHRHRSRHRGPKNKQQGSLF